MERLHCAPTHLVKRSAGAVARTGVGTDAIANVHYGGDRDEDEKELHGFEMGAFDVGW